MLQKVSIGMATFVLLREKVRAVRSVKATDGIVMAAQGILERSMERQTNTITQSRG